MATYSELVSAKQDSDLQDKVEAAVTIAALAVLTESPQPTNHTERLKWSKRALENPRGMALSMLPAVIAANKDVALSVILSATDPQVQAAVDASVDVFAQSDPVTP